MNMDTQCLQVSVMVSEAMYKHSDLQNLQLDKPCFDQGEF